MYIIRNKVNQQVLLETDNPDVLFQKIQPFERSDQFMELEIDGKVLTVAEFVKEYYKIWGVHSE